MMRNIVLLFLVCASVLATRNDKPFRTKDNNELLAWYLENPSDETPVEERFGQNVLTIRRIPATETIHKRFELWNPKDKAVKVMTVNLKYYKDPQTGWETLQGLDCPKPPTNQAPEVAKCVSGYNVGKEMTMVLLSSNVDSPSIEDQVRLTAECIKDKVKIQHVEWDCFTKALTPEEIKKTRGALQGYAKAARGSMRGKIGE